MIKKIIWSLLFISLLVSCNKERTLHVKAINAVTGLPYSGLRFIVTEEKSGSFQEDYKTVYDGNLDNNGEAYATVKIRKNRSYSIRCEEPPNTCYNKKISYSYAVEDDQNPTFLFEFAECAYMRQNIVNSNCEGTTDVFNIRDKFVYTDWSGWSYDIMGCFTNTGGDYFKVPEGKRYFQWKVTRNSGVTEHLDSIELASGQYGELNINY